MQDMSKSKSQVLCPAWSDDTPPGQHSDTTNRNLHNKNCTGYRCVPTESFPVSNVERSRLEYGGGPVCDFFYLHSKISSGHGTDRYSHGQTDAGTGTEKPWSIVRTHLEHGAVSLGLGLGVGRERPLVNLVRVGGGRPLVVVRRGHVGVLQFLHFISFQHDKFIINTIVNHTSSKKTSHREQTRYFVSHVSVKDIKQVCKQVIVNKYTYVHLAQKNRA